MGCINLNERLTQKGKEITITISGSFDIDLNDEFLSIVNQITGNVCKLTVDFFDTRYLGLSAFGMLLPLRNFARQNDVNPVLRNCNPEIKASLFDAGFDRNFTIT